MPAIVAIPSVIKELVMPFGDLFPSEPSRRHVASSLTGLILADHTTVSGITRALAATSGQSCLNRFLTEAPWDVERINAHRLDRSLERAITLGALGIEAKNSCSYCALSVLTSATS